MTGQEASKEEVLEAIENGVRKAVLHALGLDYSYMFNVKEQAAFRKEITDAIQRGVAEAVKQTGVYRSEQNRD